MCWHLEHGRANVVDPQTCLGVSVGDNSMLREVASPLVVEAQQCTHGMTIGVGPDSKLWGRKSASSYWGPGTIGRVALTMAVFLVNHHFADGDIHFRTGEGAKLAAAPRNNVVAFQVDEVDRLYHAGWSVLAVGTAQELKESVDLAWATRLPLRAWAG